MSCSVSRSVRRVGDGECEHRDEVVSREEVLVQLMTLTSALHHLCHQYQHLHPSSHPHLHQRALDVSIAQYVKRKQHLYILLVVGYFLYVWKAVILIFPLVTHTCFTGDGESVWIQGIQNTKPARWTGCGGSQEYYWYWW